jgi:hypothetical protein
MRWSAIGNHQATGSVRCHSFLVPLLSSFLARPILTVRIPSSIAFADTGKQRPDEERIAVCLPVLAMGRRGPCIVVWRGCDVQGGRPTLPEPRGGSYAFLLCRLTLWLRRAQLGWLQIFQPLRVPAILATRYFGAG